MEQDDTLHLARGIDRDWLGGGEPVITSDNLTVAIDTVIYFQVTDPRAASYEIQNYIQAVEQYNVTVRRFPSNLTAMLYQLPSMCPTPHHENIGFYVMAPREGTEFAVLATDALPDLSDTQVIVYSRSAVIGTDGRSR